MYKMRIYKIFNLREIYLKAYKKYDKNGMHGIIRAIAKDLHPLLNTILFKKANTTSIS